MFYHSENPEKDEHILISPNPDDTLKEWEFILFLCRKKFDIGFGALDSFLSGPDLERRISLIEKEAPANTWLRLELRDTLSLKQSNDWNNEQYQRLYKVVEIGK